MKLSRYAEVSTEGHRGGGNLERLALILLLWDWSVGGCSTQWPELNCAVLLSLDDPLYVEQENNFEFQALPPSVMFWLYIARHYFTVWRRTINNHSIWQLLQYNFLEGHYEWRARKLTPVLTCESVILESPKTDTGPPRPDCTAVSADSQSWCARSDHSCSP